MFSKALQTQLDWGNDFSRVYFTWDRLGFCVSIFLVLLSKKVAVPGLRCNGPVNSKAGCDAAAAPGSLKATPRFQT